MGARGRRSSARARRHEAGRKSAKPAAKQTANALPAWLGRRRVDDDAETLPAADLSGALARVLSTRPHSLQTTGEPPDKEPIRAALGAIEAALYTIDQIRDILEQAIDVARSARGLEDAGGRALFAESYDDLRHSIGATLGKIDEHAAPLIGKDQRHLDVPLGGKAHYSISPTRVDAAAKGLNLDPPRDAFATDDEIDRIVEKLSAAIESVDRAAAGYCRDAQFLIARLSPVKAA